MNNEEIKEERFSDLKSIIKAFVLFALIVIILLTVTAILTSAKFTASFAYKTGQSAAHDIWTYAEEISISDNYALDGIITADSEFGMKISQNLDKEPQIKDFRIVCENGKISYVLCSYKKIKDEDVRIYDEQEQLEKLSSIFTKSGTVFCRSAEEEAQGLETD